MPKVCPRIGDPLVPEGASLWDRTLRDERDTVGDLSSSLVNSVPVDGELETLHHVVDVHYNLVSLTHLEEEIV